MVIAKPGKADRKMFLFINLSWKKDKSLK